MAAKQTLKAWAKELRLDPATLGKRMRKAGHEVSPKKLWSAREVFVAWVGDKEAALTRQALALADKMERDNAEAERSLIPRAEAAAFITRTFAVARELVASMPVIMAARVNPEKPDHARAHLEDWVDTWIKQCRAQVPPGKDGDDE